MSNNDRPDPLHDVLAQRLETAAAAITPSTDLMSGVHRRHRRRRHRRVATRALASVATVLVIGALAIAVWPDSDTTTSVTADGERSATTTMTPTATIPERDLIACLQGAAVPITADDGVVAFTEIVVGLDDFTDAYLGCVAAAIGAPEPGSPAEQRQRIDAADLYVRAQAGLERALTREVESLGEINRRLADELAELEADLANPDRPSPPRFVLADPGASDLELVEIIDRDSGVVTQVFAAGAATTVQLHVVPGQLGGSEPGLESEPVEVRNTQGRITRTPDGGISLAWQEQDQLALELAVSTDDDTPAVLTETDLVELAAHLIEVDEAEWTQYRTTIEPAWHQNLDLRPGIAVRNGATSLELDVPGPDDVPDGAAFLVVLHDGNPISRANLGSGGRLGIPIPDNITELDELDYRIGLENDQMRLIVEPVNLTDLTPQP